MDLEIAPAPPEITPQLAKPGLFARVWKDLIACWKFLIGVFCAQGLLLSILLVGWTYRFMQRTALKLWWVRSASIGKGATFEEFVARESETRVHLHWPNWILAQNFREAFRATRWRALAQSLWQNLRIGIAGAFNTLVLTLPGCILMLFGWYDGWNNSFNKGYEQAAVGPVVSLVGIFMFAIAMLYVPMAQARQAITGEWRSFYQWRLVWRLVRLRWLWCVGLSVCYLLLWAPIMILRAVPTFWPQIAKLGHEQVEALSHTEAIQNLNQYFFWCGFFIVAAFLFLRWLAARNYALGICTAVKNGLIGAYALSDFERLALGRLALLEVTLPPQRHVLLRLTARLWRFAARTAAIALMLLVWVLFVFELYISQFFHYIPGMGWLNHCLVQLPWFHYIPAHLK
jgi:hypothetical protein